jgi:hypothetical protein
LLAAVRLSQASSTTNTCLPRAEQAEHGLQHADVGFHTAHDHLLTAQQAGRQVGGDAGKVGLLDDDGAGSRLRDSRVWPRPFGYCSEITVGSARSAVACQQPARPGLCACGVAHGADEFFLDVDHQQRGAC